MTRTLAAMVAAASLIAGPALAQASKTPHVTDTSFVSANGARTIQESAVINAPVAILWKAFTDTEEFKRWNSPVAAIDLRVGGSLEASYDAKHALGDPDNIKHRIVTFLPNRLVVFQNIQAPRGLAGAAYFQQTVTVVDYQVLGPNQTRVTVSSTGWTADPKADHIYNFFRSGNAELLERMKTVYEAKPAG
jgi:uncharacterized protein YndB with AHSA1/START domain